MTDVERSKNGCELSRALREKTMNSTSTHLSGPVTTLRGTRSQTPACADRVPVNHVSLIPTLSVPLLPHGVPANDGRRVDLSESYRRRQDPAESRTIPESATVIGE